MYVLTEKKEEMPFINRLILILFTVETLVMEEELIVVMEIKEKLNSKKIMKLQETVSMFLLLLEKLQEEDQEKKNGPMEYPKKVMIF